MVIIAAVLILVGLVVLADGYAEFQPWNVRPDISVNSYFILGVLPGLEYQARRGDAYYVICDLSYGRYFEPSAKPAPGYEQECARAKRFYEALLKQQPIWSSVPERPIHAFTNPTIYVYKVGAEGLKF